MTRSLFERLQVHCKECDSFEPAELRTHKIVDSLCRDNVELYLEIESWG